MNRATLIRAAEILEREAGWLADSNTIGADGLTWAIGSDDERADCEEMREIAVELRTEAA